MLPQSLIHHLAIAIILFEGFYRWDSPKSLEGLKVEIVYVGDVGVGDDHVGECLHITQSMCDAVLGA